MTNETGILGATPQNACFCAECVSKEQGEHRNKYVEIRRRIHEMKTLKKILTIISTILAVLITTIAALLVFSLKWMFKTWSNLTMDELVFHLQAPLEGTNEGMIVDYINECAVPAILIFVFVVVVLVACRKQKKYFLVMVLSVIISVGAMIISVADAWAKLDVGGYTESQSTYSTFVDDYYVDPANVEITFPQQKRNLIYIFLESMETTYADEENGGAFEKNCIPELTQLALENEDFSGSDSKLNGGYSMPGTTWTMGAMFAQTSGLPLNIPIEKNSMNTQDSFFKGAVTLGDILEDAGYSQTLMIGSDAYFGGRELYFTSHGHYDMLDYYYAVKNHMIPEDYRVWWGYEDEKLFDFAKEKLLELADEEGPFNFTMLTVDTHFEDGYVCQICPDTFGDDQYANVMACSSSQVSEFIEWIKEQPFYENTTIVLAGDHPTMDTNFCENVDESYVRKTYVSYINSAVEVETTKRREYTTFDMFPTVLGSLGVSIEGERLGLGTNLFSSVQTLSERFGNEKIAEEVGKKSKLIEELSEIKEETQEVEEVVDPTAIVTVDAYDFKTGMMPVMVYQIENAPETVQSVKIAVWTEENQSDLQWIQMGMDENGNYIADINVPSFSYKEGMYYIVAFLEDDGGNIYTLGGTIGFVD